MLKVVVLDTNCVISAFIKPISVAADGLEIALMHFDLVFSRATLAELADVASRPQWDKFLSIDIRKTLVFDYAESARQITVNSEITDCRDAKDNQFLALAHDAGATLIVTGDKDLLVLHPWRGVHIITLRTFLDTYKDYL